MYNSIIWPRGFAYFDPDKGAGGGGGNGGGSGAGDSENTDPPAGEGNQDPPKPGDDPPAPKGKEKEVDWSDPAARQRELDRIASEARRKGKEAGKSEAEQAAQRAKETAEAAEKVKQGEFQSLYEAEKAKREALEAEIESKYKPAAEERDQFAETLHKHIDGEIKDWHKDLKKQDPGRDKPISERMDWVERSRDLSKTLENKAPSMQGGDQGGGKPSDQVNRYVQGQYAIPSNLQPKS